MSQTGQRLREMYDAMHRRFGHQGWWPGETPFEVCIGAILTQNTNWGNVEKALANLRAAERFTLERIHATPAPALAELIRPAGYYNVKAKRLRNFCGHLVQRWGGDLDAFLDQSVSSLTEELLSINGIGRETADSIILYAARKPTFVVDRYTARILLRHYLIDVDADYDQIKDLFESALPEDEELFNDYHAQLVAVGKNFCRPTAICEGCPLEPFEHDRYAGSTDADA